MSIYMNEYDVLCAVENAAYFNLPLTHDAAVILSRYVNWVNDNSDGWPYWTKARNAAARLQTLVHSQMEDLRSARESDITDEQIKHALIPLRAFLTRQGVDHDEVLA